MEYFDEWNRIYMYIQRVDKLGEYDGWKIRGKRI